MRPSDTPHYVRLHFIVFIYGFTGILGELINLDALRLVWHRMWIASAFIFIYLLLRRRLDFNLSQNGLTIFLAGVIIVLHWITFFHAIKISNVSVALSCIATGALFGSLLEPLFYKRKIDRAEIFLGLIVVLGLYLIFRFEGDYTAGILTALLSAFLSALFSVINSKLIRSSTPYRITFLEMFGGWLALTAFLMISGELNRSLFVLQANDWTYLLILGGVCTAYAFIENVSLLRHLSSFSILLAINLEPVYGIILAILLFNESEVLSPFFYLGTGIILSTVFADAFIKRRRRKAAAKPTIV